MNESKWYYYIDSLGWDGFFGPYHSKEEAIDAARTTYTKNFYITYGTETIDFFLE
ncbi:MAG: hypothetical protein Q4E51_08740 [Lachnospiraceae bacterium]|nr:hypothetical protein [Lachnospiraceae bacterium]